MSVLCDLFIIRFIGRLQNLQKRKMYSHRFKILLCAKVFMELYFHAYSYFL